jgi:hypothetical protein
MRGFFAFPSKPELLINTIRSSVELGVQRGLGLNISTWEELDIPGRFISSEILTEIESSDFLIADISRLNFNVLYEIGYAIGRNKRIVLTKNSALRTEDALIKEVGIVDTLGYTEYSTSEELLRLFYKINDLTPLHVRDERNTKAPLYLIQPQIKSDYDSSIVSAVKKTHLFFRSHDPAETARLSGREAIANVSMSYGVVLHFIANEQHGSQAHNLKSAFVAGLADGMDRHSVYIQSGSDPVPLDYRDFVRVCMHPSDFRDAVGEFAEQVIEDIQGHVAVPNRGEKTILDSVDFGASAAENEITSLAEYYLEIDAFNRACRQEVRLVTGRKGSGKTALFFRLRDTKRENRANVVLDLMPEGYQLLKFKDAVVRLLSTGTVEHTITAFWEYLLWLQICHRLLDKDRDRHKTDHRLFEPYQRLMAEYGGDVHSTVGDFAERLRNILRDISSSIDSKYSGQTGIELTTPEITEFVYRKNFHRLKDVILEYFEFKDELWLLFDNIDKGWSISGISSDDLVIVRALLEATRKIERELRRRNIVAHTVVFLRNDVYERLLAATVDRGKETRANVDWSDSDLLRKMLLLRMKRSMPDTYADEDFGAVWAAICTPLIDGEETSQYLIDRCLMRPRCLLDLVGHCKGYAINLGHQRIERDDIRKGLHAFSNDLFSELDLEIRDSFPGAGDALYSFLGAKSRMKRPELEQILTKHGISVQAVDELIDTLLWFGFLGLVSEDGDTKYIYSYHYNMNVLSGVHRKLLNSDNFAYVLNPAFGPVLGLS